MSTFSINSSDSNSNLDIEDKDVAFLKKKQERKLSGIRERYSSKYAPNSISTSNNSNGSSSSLLYNIDNSFLPSYSSQPFLGSTIPPMINNNNNSNNNHITSEEDEEESEDESDDSVEILDKESLIKLNQSTQNNLDELQSLIQTLLGDSKSPDNLSQNEYLQYQQMIEQQEQLERERKFLQEFEKEQQQNKEKHQSTTNNYDNNNLVIEEDSLSSGDTSLRNSMSNENRDLSTSKTPLIDIGLEYKYRIKLEKDPKDHTAMIKWGNLIVKKIKEQLGGYDIDVCLLDWNEDLIPIPSQSTQAPPNTPFTDSLQSYLIKEPLFDACSKYQHALQLSGGLNSTISFSSLLNFSISNSFFLSPPNNSNKNLADSSSSTATTTSTASSDNSNITTKPKSGTINRMLRAVSLPPPPPTPGTDDPNSPWSDFNLWLKWGDCLYLLCTYLELPMYKSTCEKYYKCVLLLQKQQYSDENRKSLSCVLRKWGITLSRYSRRMKCQFLMSEWSNEENIQVEELWKILHSQSIQSLSYSQFIYPSPLTTYHLATAFLRHAITLNQFGGNRAQIYGLVVRSCDLYKQCLLDPEEFYSTENLLKTSNENLPTNNSNSNNNINVNINNIKDNNNSPRVGISFNDVEILNDLQCARSIENWGRALDIQLTVKLNEDESMEKEEEDLHAVDEYLTTFSKVILRGIVPSLEGIVNLCLNSRQAIQYKAINSLSVLCRSKEIVTLPINDELLEHLSKVESFVFKRDDAESLLSQQRTLKSMPPKLQAYVRMSGLTEDEIMKNFEIAWNSIYFLTKDTIPNQPVPPNYYRSNKKNKKKGLEISNLYGNNSLSDNNITGDSREPIIPSLHRSNISNLIITPYTENSPEPKFNSLKPHATLNFKKHSITGSQSKITIEPRSSQQILSNSIGNNSNSNNNNNNNNIFTTSLNSSMISVFSNSGNQWSVTVPIKKPTRRATISEINKIQEDEYLQAKLKKDCISKYLSSEIKRTTVKPPPLDRCDESIFSSGNPLALFRDKVKLGTGAFGNVFYAIRKQDSKPIAIKVLMERTKKGSPIIPELYVHSACNHPNIVSYYESYLCKGHLWIIMEYCDGGTVRDLIQDDWKNNQALMQPQPLEEPLIAYVTKQLLEGLVYLRSKGIIHRDIKSRNILLTRRGKVKIADFGLATCCSLGRGRTRMCGTMGRIAPEIVRREPYDTQADVYSLGCLLVELAEGMVPYGKDSSLKALFYTAIYDYKLTNTSRYSSEFVDFLNLCLLSDPFIRPTPEMLLQHQFFHIHSFEKGKQILLEKFKGQDCRKNMILESFVPF